MRTKKLNKKALKAAVQAVLCGKEDTIRIIPNVEAPTQKARKRLRKRLAADEQWQLDGDQVYRKGEVAFQGIASWGSRICIRLDGHDHRFRILYLDRFQERKAYLLPVGRAIKCLPDIDLGEGELPLLIEMANSISNPSAGRESLRKLKNPLRRKVRARVRKSRRLDWDAKAFLDLLESYPELLPCLTAALDSQLRALKKMRNAPVGFYNFLCPPRDAAAQDWVLSVFRAVTFSNETSEHPGPIVVQDIDTWGKCYRRLTVINATSRELIRPLLNSLQGRDQLWKCGDCLPPFSPTLPIAVSKSAVCSPFCVDIQLSQGLEELSGQQQDLLRRAMGKVLSIKTAKKARRELAERMRSPSAYRWSGFKVWREILAEQMVATWFASEELAKRATSLLQQSQQHQDAEEQARRAAVRSAYEYLAAPDRYKDRITNLPATKAAAEDLLSDESFAFNYTPIRGEYKGNRLLVFNRDSLCRLLRSIKIGDDLYDALLDFCDKEGLLVRRDHAITIGGETFHGITFQNKS